MSDNTPIKRTAKPKVKPQYAGEFFPQTTVEQAQRRSTQAFLKMLVRDDRRTQPGFVNWVEEKAKAECGDLYSLVETQLAKRRAMNKRLAESEERNKQQNGMDK